MTIKTVYKILTELGQKMIIKNHMLMEDNGYYQAYEMLTKENRVWEYGLFRFEMQKHPHFEVEKNFETEDEAAKYFLMKSLSSIYFKKYKVFVKEHNEEKTRHLAFTVDTVKNIMQKAKVPSSYLICGKGDVSLKNAIQISETNNGKYVIATIRNGSQISNTSGELELWRAASYALSEIHNYYMYDTEIAPILEKHGVLDEITDDDFLVYIW